ncbi:MAG TPA: aminotransferase class I/II-fold pyridoxal phosphate-dependent enzyme [Bacteroidales bacterium]|mgnify:CR=1 FL=1|jgi:histidinol-phosphate/aromatic aminotransferase/cobyric acid decarboxylase-like protein/choline kinase|nr:aminotransferase class I/II-fold pyridoxal phosphate-dependent enzyme [Bacteroidales bacterium]
MQAIILAAGMGKRLGELTENNTKCMVSINGVRLIDRMLAQLVKLQLSRIIIVIGYEGQKLKNHIANHYDDKVKIEYINNPIYDKTNNIYSLALAKHHLCEDDTILLESDLIFEDEILEMLVNHPYNDLALVAKYETWMDGTMVCIDADGSIINFVPKEAFQFNNIDEYYKTVNIYKFSKEFSTHFYVPFLDAYCKVMGNNEYYEQVLRVLSHLRNSPLKALPIADKKWYEIDDVQDLDIASTLFSNGEVKYQEYRKRYGGYWRFPKILDYCYLVNPFFPSKRMKDELKANFDILLQNYPSGMYINSMLAGKYFGIKQDYIVVGNGATELVKIVMEEHAGDKVGIIYPTFDEYPNRLQDEQIISFIPKNENFEYSADDLMSHFDNKNISLLLLINPDNPSGHFMPKNDVIKLAEWSKIKGITLLVDESFVDFTYGFEENSLLNNHILEDYPNLWVMKSISKSYGVPGLRLGIFATSNIELIAKIKKEVSIWNINSFAEFYLQIYGKYEDEYKKACVKFIEERERFFNELKTIPYLRVIPSQANYFLCEVLSKFTSAELTQELILNDVIISNCGLKKNMAGQQLVRFAIRSKQDNTKLINILRSF